ncbi:hypothetical protein VTL71DRAFT_5382 [Oculimacula yallundae]|uniref:RING-type domain-containing protein n=1 Tax=Oculimacula yallundae TaxID=86028 RepID=A0ABR4C101_9HELO
MAPRIPAGLYDDMDDATSTAILEIQINDIDELIAEAIDAKDDDSNDPSEWEIALKIHKEELQQGLSVIRDRKLSQAMAQAVMVERNSNNSAIAAAITQERLAENDRAVALRLAGLPVPPPIQQALAGLGSPAIPQMSRQAAAPPRQPPGLGTIPTPPQTPQYHSASHPQPVAREILSNMDPALTAANQLRQQTPQHTSTIIVQLQPATPRFSPTTALATESKPDSQLSATFSVPGRSLPAPSLMLPAFAPATSFNPWSLTPAKKKPQVISNNSAPTPSSSASQNLAAPSPDDSSCRASDGLDILTNKAAAEVLPLKVYPLPDHDVAGSIIPSLNSLPPASVSRTSPLTSNGDKSSVDKSEANSRSTPCRIGEFTTKPQKRKLDDDRDTGPQTKKVHLGDQNSVNSGTKRPREEDADTGSRPNKRVDTGAGKTTEFTGDAPDSDKIVTEQAGLHDEVMNCVCCADSFEPAYTCQMPCKHDYCHFCVQRVVINALVDEALFPPRCCKQSFDMDSMRNALTPELISGFHEKKAEFETIDRTYCSNTKCSTFLYPVNIVADTATCPLCFTTTCTMFWSCQLPKAGSDVNIAKEWFNLSSAATTLLVYAGPEWCYVCGVAWKNCPCPVWDENRLLERANQIADRNPQPVGPARQEQVAAIAREVFENHECDHDEWERIDGEEDCEECGDELPYFIWRCRDCDFDACSRYRYNVL